MFSSLSAVSRVLLSVSIAAAGVLVAAPPAQAATPNFSLRCAAGGIPAIPTTIGPGDAISFTVDNKTCKDITGGQWNGKFFVAGKGTLDPYSSFKPKPRAATLASFSSQNKFTLKDLTAPTNIWGQVAPVTKLATFVFPFEKTAALLTLTDYAGKQYNVTWATRTPVQVTGQATHDIGSAEISQWVSVKDRLPSLGLNATWMTGWNETMPKTRLWISTNLGQVKLDLTDTQLTNLGVVQPTGVAAKANVAASQISFLMATDTAKVTEVLAALKVNSSSSGLASISVIAAPQSDPVLNATLTANKATAPGQGWLSSGVVYNPKTDSFYEAVKLPAGTQLTWPQAKCLAANRYFTDDFTAASRLETDPDLNKKVAFSPDPYDTEYFSESTLVTTTSGGVTTTTTQNVFDTATCANGSYNNGNYFFSVQRKFRGLPGQLAQVTSLDEIAFARDSVRPLLNANKNAADNLWVGAYQVAGSAEPAGGWRWIAGKDRLDAGFPWQGSEPNDGNGNENYGDLYAGQLNDVEITGAGDRGVLIEYEAGKIGTNYPVTSKSTLTLKFTPPPPPACVTSDASLSSGQVRVKSLTEATFPVNFAAGYDANFIGYRVTPQASVSNTWVKVTDFAGGSITLAAKEAPAQLLGSLSGGASKAFYMLAKATKATTTAQTHKVTVYDGDPALATSTPLCQTTSTIVGVNNSTTADPDSVTDFVATKAPADYGSKEFAPGEVMDVEVSVTTGAIGNGPSGTFAKAGMLALAPVSKSTFPSDSWRLSGVRFYSDATNLEASDVLSRSETPGASRSYKVKFTFTALKPAAATALTLTPIVYKSGATNVEFTGEFGESIMPKVANSLKVSTTVAPTGVSSQFGGEVVVTTTVSNSAAAEASFDYLLDTLPAGLSYKAGTFKVNNSVATGLSVELVGAKTRLVYSNLAKVPAKTTNDGTVVFSYTLIVPAGTTSYANSAVAYLGEALIGVEGIDTAAATATISPVAAPVVAAKSANVAPADSATNVTPTVTYATGSSASSICLAPVGTPDCAAVSTALGTWTLSSALGTWTLSSALGTWTLSFDPTTGQSGTATVQYRVTDTLGQISTAIVTVVVDPVPVVPSVSLLTGLTKPVSDDVKIAVSAADPTLLSFSEVSAGVPSANSACLVNPKTGACEDIVTLDGVGIWSFDQDESAIRFSPAANFVGSAFVSLVATAGSGVSARSGSGDITAVVTSDFAMTTTALEQGRVGSAWSQQLVAAGGSENYEWSLSDGALPEWLTLDKSGQLSGTPSESGSFSFTLRVCDVYATAFCVDRTFTLLIDTALPPPVDPLIPQSPPVIESIDGGGDTVALTCVAPGFSQTTQSVDYLWFKDGVEFARTRSISVVKAATAQTFTCRVTGFASSATGTTSRDVTVPAKASGSLEPQKPQPPTVVNRKLTFTMLFAANSPKISATEMRRLRTFLGQFKVVDSANVTGFVQGTRSTANDRALSAARASAVAKFVKGIHARATIAQKAGGRSPITGAKGRKVTVTVVGQLK